MPELIITKDIDAPGLDTLEGYREQLARVQAALKEMGESG